MFRLTLLFIFICMFSLNACKEKTKEEKILSLQKKHTSGTLGQLYSGYYANPTSLDEEEQNLIIEYATDKELPLRRTKSGLYYLITKEGKGPRLRWGERVIVDYRGYFLDGNEFDSSYSRGEPIKFSVGEMMRGWNEGLRLMKSGSKATIIVPSRLGYGEKGFDGYVPPNTITAFDIDVKI